MVMPGSFHRGTKAYIGGTIHRLSGAEQHSMKRPFSEPGAVVRVRIRERVIRVDVGRGNVRAIREVAATKNETRASASRYRVPCFGFVHLGGFFSACRFERQAEIIFRIRYSVFIFRCAASREPTVADVDESARSART